MNQQPIQAPKPAVSKWLWISLIVVVLGAAGYFGWYYLKGPGKKVATSTTSTTPTSTTTTPSSTTTTPTTTTTDKTADWKTYNNSTYGISVKYPTDWTLAEKTFSKNGDVLATLTSPETTTAAKTNKLLKEDVTIRYSDASAKSTDVSSNTIGVWLKDQFTNSVTVSNATKETIGGIEYNEATMNADPSYFAMITTQTKGLFAIDFPNIDSKNKLTDTENTMLSSFQFTK